MDGQRARRVARYELTGCTRRCSLNPGSMPGKIGQLVHSWFETGDNNMEIIAKAAVMGIHFSNGAIGRHRQMHLERVDIDALPDPSQGAAGVRRTDLEVLEVIIGRGAMQVELATSKISAEQLLRAIELKHRLTEGSIFDSLFGAFEEEGDAALEPGVVAGDPAVASSDEVAQEAALDGSEA